MRYAGATRGNRSITWFLALAIGGCGAGRPPMPLTKAPLISGSFSSVRLGASDRCKPFDSAFEQSVACRRADGTVASFGDRRITWRVRYYVRYWEMPCGEEPTVEEAYVFHMVTDDLYDDADLNDAERLAIRAAMYDERARCK